LTSPYSKQYRFVFSSQDPVALPEYLGHLANFQEDNLPIMLNNKNHIGVNLVMFMIVRFHYCKSTSYILILAECFAGLESTSTWTFTTQNNIVNYDINRGMDFDNLSNSI